MGGRGLGIVVIALLWRERRVFRGRCVWEGRGWVLQWLSRCMGSVCVCEGDVNVGRVCGGGGRAGYCGGSIVVWRCVCDMGIGRT